MKSMDWPPIYEIRRHPRARHVKLYTEPGKGLVMSVPKRFNLRDVPAILDENRFWIEKQLSRLSYVSDALPTHIQFPLLNEQWQIHYEPVAIPCRLWQRADKEMVLSGEIENHRVCQQLLSKWVHHYGKRQLPPLFQRISEETGLIYQSVSVRRQKRIWGSCTGDHAIFLNYKLILLPAHLARYVMIHELSHTVHLNHSKLFWELVSQCDPDWRSHRKALRLSEQSIPHWL